MTAPAIVLSDVGLRLGGSVLFSDLSLTIPGGRTTCILGPSGCGKSTLLRLISGAADLQSTGTIRLEPASTGIHQTAWMGQSDLLLPWATLLDNVLLGARLRGDLTPDKRARAVQLIAQAGLAGHENTLPRLLSGGMRQRAALLRTLMEDRPIILMDEPFSALDALTRLRLQDLTATLTRQATVVLVTHDPLEALRLGHRVVVLGPDARITDMLDLDGNTPRDCADPSLAVIQAGLLDRILKGIAA